MKGAAGTEGGAPECLPSLDHGVDPCGGAGKLVQQHGPRVTKFRIDAMDNSPVGAGGLREIG